MNVGKGWMGSYFEVYWQFIHNIFGVNHENHCERGVTLSAAGTAAANFRG